MTKTHPEVYCPVHPLTVMICPVCVGKGGGAATVRKYGTRQLAEWGRKGGRPKKKGKKKKAKKRLNIKT